MTPNILLEEPIAVLGAGVAGLITSHVLLKDGFKNLTLITRDASVGGTWARTRVYDGLYINNVHGEYRSSALPMPPPRDGDGYGGRLSGLDLCNYLENFFDTFLKGNVQFLPNTEIRNVNRDETGEWTVSIEDLPTSARTELKFARVVLATGGCSEPKVPDALSPAAAEKAGFDGPVIHSQEFGSRINDLLSATKPATSPDAKAEVVPENDVVVVVGGGKSARDVCAKLANEGRRPVMVFETTEVAAGAKKPAPDFLRKGRLASVFMPHRVLNSRLERFLHTTSLGAAITRSMWNGVESASFDTFDIPPESPLRLTKSLYWEMRASDEGNPRPTMFFNLVNAGAITLKAPARVTGYANDGVILSTGEVILAKAVVLATGYKSSWTKIFTPEMTAELGIDPHIPVNPRVDNWAHYKTLEGAPPTAAENEKFVTSIYRGIVPAKNIKKRDFVFAGALFTANFGYTSEVAGNWIASYLRGDPMRLPTSTDGELSVEAAIKVAEEECAWMQKRYPSIVSWENHSYSTSLDSFTWCQASDELLEDMYLPSRRSGGNWLNWIFKVIDSKEIEFLTEERAGKRKAADRLRGKATDSEGERHSRKAN